MTNDISHDGGDRPVQHESSDSTMIARPLATPATVIPIGHFLTYTEGSAQVRVPIGPDGLVIGRAAPADLQVAAPEISRQHCRIDIYGDEALLTDLGSTNGTFLDGARLARPARLHNDSRISLGAFPILYERRDLRKVSEEAELVADLRRAEDYVRAILPPPIPAGPVRTAWCFVPSTKLGGDAFGYQFLDTETFAGFLLDVSGHGIGSAMHAANVANALRRRALPGIDFRDPAAVATGLNEIFPMEEHNDLMLTLWYFTYHLPSRVLRYCAAGHHAAFLVTPAAPEPQPLWARGPVIGMLPVGRWATGSAEIPPGSRLYISSDGAFEILGADGREGCLEDLRVRIAEPAQPGLTEPDRLYRSVRDAARPGPLDDDFSLLVVSFE